MALIAFSGGTTSVGTWETSPEHSYGVASDTYQRVIWSGTDGTNARMVSSDTYLLYNSDTGGSLQNTAKLLNFTTDGIFFTELN